MIRFVFRFAGLFVLAAGFVALLLDGTRSIAADAIRITPLTEIWTQLHPDSLKWARGMIEQHAPPWIWDPVSVTVLGAPGSLVLAILGAILLLLGRRKKAPSIGYGPEP